MHPRNPQRRSAHASTTARFAGSQAILFIHARRHFQRAAAERTPGRRQPASASIPKASAGARGRWHSRHRDRRRHRRRRCRRTSVVRRDRLGRSHRAQRRCRRHGPGLARPARLPRVLAPGRIQGRSRSRLAHRTHPSALPWRGKRYSAPRQQRALSQRDRRLVQGGRDPGRRSRGRSPARRCIIRWP